MDKKSCRKIILIILIVLIALGMFAPFMVKLWR